VHADKAFWISVTRLFKLRDSSTEAKQPAEQHDGSLSLARASCTDSTSEGNPSLTSEGNPSLSSSDGKVSGSLVMWLSSQAGCEILKVSSDAVLLCIILRLVDSCCVCRCLIILDSKRFANMVCRKKGFWCNAMWQLFTPQLKIQSRIKRPITIITVNLDNSY
jgi:hypothetical protein